MTEMFGARRKFEDRERAAVAKCGWTIAAVADRLGVDHEIGVECPHCGVYDLPSVRTLTATCGTCKRPVDVLDLVRAVKGFGFVAACNWLEENKAGGCPQTGRLDL